MDIQLVQSSEAFLKLRTEWNDLLCRSTADTIFLTWEWLSSWWESYAGKKDVLHILTVREHGNLIGILPFFRRSEPWLPLCPVRTMHLIGDGSYDSDYLDVILVKGREEEILNSIWNYLGANKSIWNVVQFTGLPDDSVTAGWLKQISERQEVVARTESIPCSVTDLPASWDEYLAQMKPRFRTKVRSTLRDLAAQYQLRFYSIDRAEDLNTALQILFELHGKRWELKGTDGVFRNPAKQHFYERFARLFLDRGWLAFDFLELDGRPVACQMCFRYGDTQFLLQEGFDPQFGDESVGIGLRALVFKKAIESGIKHYDFLAGVGRHKTQWQARLKTCRTIAIGRRSIQNTIYLKGPVLMDAFRERIKAMLPTKVLEIRRRLVAS